MNLGPFGSGPRYKRKQSDHRPPPPRGRERPDHEIERDGGSRRRCSAIDEEGGGDGGSRRRSSRIDEEGARRNSSLETSSFLWQPEDDGGYGDVEGDGTGFVGTKPQGCRKWWLGCLSFAVVIVSCAAGIYYIRARGGNPFKLNPNEPADGASAMEDSFSVSLEADCSETSLQTLEGIQKCHNKCQTHICCFASDLGLTDSTCQNVHVDACEAYKACERLVAPKAKDPSTKGETSAAAASPPDLDEVAAEVERACELPNVADLASPEWVTKSYKDWVTSCHSACAERLCCLVDANIGSNCRATVGKKECDVYSPCEVLINEKSGKEITTAMGAEKKFADVEDIGKICNEGVTKSSEMYEGCKERCNQRSCCFEDNPAYSCYNMEKEWCNEFSSCGHVGLSPLTDPGVSAGGEKADSATGNAVPAFESEPTSSGDSPLDPNPDSFKKICSVDNVRQNWDACGKHCAGLKCCFMKENSCYDQKKEQCDEYSICEDFFLYEVGFDEETKARIDAERKKAGSLAGNVPGEEKSNATGP